MKLGILDHTFHCNMAPICGKRYTVERGQIWPPYVVKWAMHGRGMPLLSLAIYTALYWPQVNVTIRNGYGIR